MEQGQKMRVSCQQGRSGAKSANHNARHLKNPEERTHINPDKTKGNICIVMIDDTPRRIPNRSGLFKELMIETYAHHYKDHLDDQNSKYHQKRQYKREKSIEELFEGKKTAPIEQILQIGKEGEYPITPQNIRLFDSMIRDYIDTLKETFPGIIILGYVIHTDEASLHAHLTYSIPARDELGREYPQQDKGLKAMGIELPHPEKDTSRYNNRLMTFTQKVRDIWISAIKKKAPELELELKPAPSKRKHLSTIDYKIMMGELTLEKQKKLIRSQEQTIEENQTTIDTQVIALAELDDTGELEAELSAARTRQRARSR